MTTCLTPGPEGPSAQPLLVEDLDEPDFPDPLIGHERHPGFVAVLAEVAVAEVGHRSPHGPRKIGGESAPGSGLHGIDLEDTPQGVRWRVRSTAG